MKALLLNGEKDNKSLNVYSKIIRKELKSRDYEVNTVILHEKRIADCIGCFGCWIKKPGVCIIDDYAQKIANMFINSDLVIYLTPIVFGGDSYQLKKALDRMIPLISPFFIKVDGEIHHKPRYKEYPSILGIGVMSNFNEEQVQLFNNLIKRNSINFHSPNYVSEVIVSDKDIDHMQKKINKLLNKVSDKNE
ncbi:flavodoxin family protein [Halothermothrix orenii]|uniref:Multimeric flavodoxin WrbA n=1 Tax=Halothermothrix orenii (strain H 168 / OCM 544 / DSM 9562) TaxID=373903 RepID=B8CXU6_HALOH|nr:NAD(P)H-dependent oxidoreductase [Halothermothrix orenii]ACL70115.1 Multimeric flavodoxin WrbA [Halothermothrix orenii H 168]